MSSVVSSPIPGLIRRLDQAESRIVLGAVKQIKKDADTEAGRVAGADRRLSNAGRAKLRARDTWRRGAVSATVFAVPAGMWRWVTDGTGPHLIGVGRANRRTGNYAPSRFARSAGGRGRRQRPMRIGGGWRMGPFAHPGTRGKGAWDRVRKQAPKALRKAAEVEVRKVTRG